MCKKLNRKLSVEEAIQGFLKQLSDLTGWKYLKSSKCLKKVIGDLVLEVRLFSSKWNLSYEKVEIQCECQMWCKKFDKKSNIKSSIGYYKIEISDLDWWDITTEKKLTQVLNDVYAELEKSILPLSRSFEADFLQTVKSLATYENMQKYRLRLEFIDVYAGRIYIEEVAKVYTQSLSEIFQADMVRYKNGARDKSWMINPSNLKYIIDQGIV